MAAVLQPQHQVQTYTFSSQPRAVQQRSKYRQKTDSNKPDDPNMNQQATAAVRFGNLMYDRRVVRGSTYSQHILPATAVPDPIEMQRVQEQRRRALAKKKAQEQMRPRTPEALPDRHNQDVQTELYLEELADRIEEADAAGQTDDFLDRPASPLFIPAKSGSDAATQILPGELFHFDIEVRPILEVLVGKTLEQSCLEVMEEEELARLRAQQRVYLELRQAEKVEEQRLEEQDRRRNAEKQRRKRQQEEVMRRERETAEKIAARAFAQSYLADLVPTVFGTLAENGYFFDPVERDVERGFLGWLMGAANTELCERNLARATLDGLIREIVQDRHLAYHRLAEQIEQARLAAEAAKALGGAGGMPGTGLTGADVAGDEAEAAATAGEEAGETSAPTGEGEEAGDAAAPGDGEETGGDAAGDGEEAAAEAPEGEEEDGSA